MEKRVKQTIEAYLNERPSVHIGMEWDAEGFLFGVSNSGSVYAVFVKRSEVRRFLAKLTVVGEDCSIKSGGGWHIRINGSTAAFRWANAQTGGVEVKGRLERLCSCDEFLAKAEQYQAMHGEKAKNLGRTFEWVCGQHFEGSVLDQHNDRKNDGTSDLTLADGTCWELKCIALTSRAQMKVQD